ncbi:MAG: amidohydrolase family protein [Thermoleophilia bacterium]|nr:amidohydrolase family protein [Thermoleophilia bacterium]
MTTRIPADSPRVAPHPVPAQPSRPAPQPAVDVHQHLWPEPFVAALARRTHRPRLRRRGGEWVLQAHGEPDWTLDLRDQDPDARARRARDEGFDRVLIAPSLPIGAESLPPDEAEALLEAYHDGVAALPGPFGAWASAALVRPEPTLLARRLASGFAGLCVPAGALADARGLERLAPLLQVAERAGAPLFVHPGPAPWQPPAPAPAGLPAWWPALTAYVAQMQAAWFLWAARGRPLHPRLRVCFALLAGLAPLHAERLAARGGAAGHDPRTFLEVSSYGPDAVRAVAAAVGPGALVHGSDLPMAAQPRLDGTGIAGDRLRRRNAHLLLTR